MRIIAPLLFKLFLLLLFVLLLIQRRLPEGIIASFVVVITAAVDVDVAFTEQLIGPWIRILISCSRHPVYAHRIR